MHLTTPNSQRTVQKLNVKHNLRGKLAQFKLDSRGIAEFVVVNDLSQIIQWNAALKFIRMPCSVINYDSTHIENGLSR